MDELLSYSLSDLLMFTPQTYARLFEHYNRSLWPAHMPVAALTLWLIVTTRHADPQRNRFISLLLATAWAAIAWLFFLRHYATIHLAAPWFGVGFAVEAVLFLVVGVIQGKLHYAWSANRWGRTGLGLLLIATLLLPLMGPWSGRAWSAIELFGLTPDPTALGTVGLLLMTHGRARWWLMPLPLLWGLISAATTLAMVMKG